MHGVFSSFLSSNLSKLGMQRALLVSEPTECVEFVRIGDSEDRMDMLAIGIDHDCHYGASSGLSQQARRAIKLDFFENRIRRQCPSHRHHELRNRSVADHGFFDCQGLAATITVQDHVASKKRDEFCSLASACGFSEASQEFAMTLAIDSKTRSLLDHARTGAAENLAACH